MLCLHAVYEVKVAGWPFLAMFTTKDVAAGGLPCMAHGAGEIACTLLLAGSVLPQAAGGRSVQLPPLDPPPAILACLNAGCALECVQGRNSCTTTALNTVS